METIDRTLLTFVVNALWQAPLAAAVVALACRWMRHAPARYTHAVCVAGLAAALLLPAASVRRFAPEQPTVGVPLQIGAGAASAAATPAAPARAAATPATLQLPAGAVSIAVWALGAFLLGRLALLAIAARKTLRICRDARPAGDCPAFDRARAAFGLDGVELRWSDGASGPVTAGRLVILPRSMEAAPDAVLETAIGHEMAHIARGDFAWNLMYEAAALPVSFHPATAWLRRQIDRTREMACDELVTARLLDSRAYAQSILEIASTMAAAPRPGYTLGVFDGNILEERIRRLITRPAAYTRRARVMIGAGLATLAVCVAIASTLAISARAQSPAQQEIRAGADAYNSGDRAAAVEHLRKAVALEPDNVRARLTLAYALSSLDRPALAAEVREQYEAVLRREPNHASAVLGMVTLNGAPRAGESRALVLKLIESDPKNKDAYYTAGVLDWLIAYPRLTKAMPGGGAHIYDQVDPALRAGLRRELLPTIEEGYRMLQIALDLDPGSSDSMAYMNLLLRLNAALADSPAEHDRLIAQADEWVGKALAARKAHPAASKTADRLDPNGPVPRYIPAPPPPPPPPPGYAPRPGRG